MSYRLSVLHSFDPLGAKVGGLETFVRDILGNLPDHFTFLMVGVDSTGKRELGRVTRETFRGKAFDFLPILHYSEEKAREATKRLKTNRQQRIGTRLDFECARNIC
jgi:hypothetical protein